MTISESQRLKTPGRKAVKLSPSKIRRQKRAGSRAEPLKFVETDKYSNPNLTFISVKVCKALWNE